MEYKIESWADSGGCYAMMQTENLIWLVDCNCEECLTLFVKPSDDDSTWFYPEDIVFSLEYEHLFDKGKEIYDALHGKMVEEFSSSYRLNKQG